jgi:hypothetical protein
LHDALRRATNYANNNKRLRQSKRYDRVVLIDHFFIFIRQSYGFFTKVQYFFLFFLFFLKKELKNSKNKQFSARFSGIFIFFTGFSFFFSK